MFTCGCKIRFSRASCTLCIMAVLPEPWKVRSVGLLLSRGGSAEVTKPTSPFDVDMANLILFLALKLIDGKEIR
jgi:hypothetical protein